MKARLEHMNRRILYTIYAHGVDQPLSKRAIDFNANGDVAEATAKEGIVLLRNRGNALPLATSAKKITILGGHADTGVPSGAGPSQVQDEKGAAVVVPLGGDGADANSVQGPAKIDIPLEFASLASKPLRQKRASRPPCCKLEPFRVR
jgi:beta-glucosidase